MADIFSPAVRSRVMGLIRGKDTSPEIRLRKGLWVAGLRYRIKNSLPGKPDLIFVTAKVAVFVDGCFWHGCPLHGRVPHTNQSFWVKKFTGNIARDLAVQSALQAKGWLVLRFWEHEVGQDLVGCVSRVIQAVKPRQAKRKFKPN